MSVMSAKEFAAISDEYIEAVERDADDYLRANPPVTEGMLVECTSFGPCIGRVIAVWWDEASNEHLCDVRLNTEQVMRRVAAAALDRLVIDRGALRIYLAQHVIRGGKS